MTARWRHRLVAVAAAGAILVLVALSALLRAIEGIPTGDRP